MGLADLPSSIAREDGQRLPETRITAAVHCAPPGNKPTSEEFRTCAAWLRDELDLVEPTVRSIVALGGLAWAAVGRALRDSGWRAVLPAFGHGVEGSAASPSGRQVAVIACYHPSQQNTFTGRLTEPMLDDVLARAASA